MINRKPVFYVRLLTIVAFIIICIILYNCPLSMVDDQGQITYIKNLSLSQIFLNDFFGFFRPVKNILFLIFMLDKPWGMHFARILTFLIAFATYFSVSKLLSRILKSDLWGSIGGGIWIIAPTLLSTLAWFSCTNIMVMVLFGTLCLNLYIKQKNVDNHKQKYLLLLMCLLIFLNLVSYEGGISILAMLFAIDFFLYPESFKLKRTWINYLYLLIPLICYFLLRVSVSKGAGDSAVKLVVPNTCFESSITDTQVVFSSAWFTMHHILLWFLPYGKQYIIGYYSWGEVSVYSIMICWLVIVGSTLFALFKKNEFPKIGLAISWIILGFLPVSNVFAFRNGPYGDYYLAYASIGIVLLLCSICQSIATSKTKNYIVAFALGIYIIYLYITNLIWLVAWQKPIIMMERTRAVFPKQINIFFNEVNYYIQRDRIDLAKEIVLAALNSGVEDVKYAVAYNYWLDGKYQEAYDFLEADAQNNRPNKWSFYFRGYLLSECLSRPNDAIYYYEEAIDYNSRKDGTYINAVNNLAFIYAMSGKEAKAIELWEDIESVYHTPDDIRKNIAIAKRKRALRDKK
jgi:hypothetical protein